MLGLLGFILRVVILMESFKQGNKMSRIQIINVGQQQAQKAQPWLEDLNGDMGTP